MHVLSSNEITEHVEHIIHEKTQLHKRSIDLTVAAIHRFTQPGNLDFGGSEFEPAKTKPINPQKKNPDDEYGWWNLNQGMYRLTFNEKWADREDILTLITAHDHAKQAGLLTETVIYTNDTSSSGMVIHVPEPGCNIKENARVATAYMIDAVA